MKPRIYIEVLPGRDFADRTNNLWRGHNPFTGKDFVLGGAWWPLHRTVELYKRKWSMAAKRAKKVEAIR